MGVLAGYSVSTAAKTTSGPTTAFERKLDGIHLMGKVSTHFPHPLPLTEVGRASMASSSSLSEPPSSPPRTPTPRASGAQKRPELAPNMPRVARRSRRSVSRAPRALESPRSPRTEGGKGKGKEVGLVLARKKDGKATADTLDNADRSDWADDDGDDVQPAMHVCDNDSDDESCNASPIPVAGVGRPSISGESTILSTDRSWTAFEPEKALGTSRCYSRKWRAQLRPTPSTRQEIRGMR